MYIVLYNYVSNNISWAIEGSRYLIYKHGFRYVSNKV